MDTTQPQHSIAPGRFKAAMLWLKRRRKPILTTLGILFGLFVLAYSLNTWNFHNINRHPRFDVIEGDTIAIFPMTDSCTVISAVTGQPVNFDMGSRHSFISRKGVERMRSKGQDVKIRKTLVYTKDHDGYHHFYTEIATVDIALPNPTLPDSAYYIRDVELIVSNRDIIGMDLLKHMVIEHRHDSNEIIIYNKQPQGFHKVADINFHQCSFGDIFGHYNRASINLIVNEEDSREYYIDTGGRMRKFEVVQPEKCRKNANGTLTRDPDDGFWIQHKCRVEFGDRVRFSTVVYADDLHTDEYSVNPLNLFDQDCVIDLINQELLIRNPQ